MNKNMKKDSDAIRLCAECRICSYTRNCKKKNIFYYTCRLLEKICPLCHRANRKLKKDFQKSRFYKKKSADNS
ncbi:MAG: hypothetical protein ABIH08_04350 [Candidatus Omnitrophota bacterium]